MSRYFSDNKTLILYYEGSYGPTLRIETTTQKWLKYFKCNILKLAKEDILEIDLASLIDIKLDNVISVVLTKTKSKKIHNEIRQVSEGHLMWSQDTESLITIAGLIDGLLVNDKPGHQYLTPEGDEILVVLGYKELR